MFIAINFIGLLVILFIAFWFWGRRQQPGTTVQTGVIEVIVEGGVYRPSTITAKAGAPVTLRFLRKDPTGCADKVVFSSLSIQQDLPLNQPIDIVINCDQIGAYPFSCAMGMYQGTLHLID